MKLIRKLFFIICALLLVWLGIFTYNRVTDGFSIYQMSSSLPPCPQYEVEATTAKKQELQEILGQKFHYLGKGCQFYAFESEDGKYVLKFLKHKHLRLYQGLNALPLPSKLRALCDEKTERRKTRVELLFSSCKLAYEKMPEETGLVFIHLNRVPQLGKKVVLIDKMGCKHSVKIDNFEYVLQKRGRRLTEIFSQCTDSSEIVSTVQKLADLVIMRCQKGVRDRDRSFVKNVALVDGTPIFIDIGQFYEDPSILSEEEQEKDVYKRFVDLQFWAEQHFPQYAPLFRVY